MKFKRFIVLFISILSILVPNIVEAKSMDSYAMIDTSIIGYTVQLAETEEEHIGDNVCQEPNVINALRVIGYFIFIGKIVIPFIIIGFGIFDLAKAVTGGDSDKVTKGVKIIGVRVLIGILVFALPSIINVILNISTNLNDEETGYSMCQTCLLDPWACENGEPEENYDSNDIFSDENTVRTTDFVEQQTSATHNAGVNGTTTSRATSFVSQQTSSTHNAGENGTTKKSPTNIFIQVEE
ncbi:MAG: hypothetical protein J5982_05250 [Bacilli bacterium]|nr:hypothetical protein [Bacilli bacterium]